MTPMATSTPARGNHKGLASRPQTNGSKFVSPSRVPPSLLSRPELEEEVVQQRQAIRALLQFKNLVESGAADRAARSRTGSRTGSPTAEERGNDIDDGIDNVQGVQQRLEQLRAANQKEIALQSVSFDSRVVTCHCCTGVLDTLLTFTGFLKT